MLTKQTAVRRGQKALFIFTFPSVTLQPGGKFYFLEDVESGPFGKAGI